MLPIRFRTTSPSLFDELFFNNFWNISLSDDSLIKVPIHDIIETEKEFIVEISLAGLKKENISIHVENDALTIAAERKEINELKYNRKESYFGKYERSFRLPENVEKNNIQASFEDGILKVVIPKLIGNTKSDKKYIEIK